MTIYSRILRPRPQHQQASLAQLVERGTSNAEVTGSTPLGGSGSFAFLNYVESSRVGWCYCYRQSVLPSLGHGRPIICLES
jgi:hypothetical protein